MATCKNCVHFDVCDALDKMNGLPKPGVVHCGFFKDQSLTIDIPCAPGTHLWRVTHPYRQEPKVTEYVVKNFRTIGKKHQFQIEVQALNVPVTNWMRFQDFHTTREAAEKELASRPKFFSRAEVDAALTGEEGNYLEDLRTMAPEERERHYLGKWVKGEDNGKM